MFCLLTLSIISTPAFARDSGPGDPGTGGNYDCSRCVGTQYPGMGNRVYYQCYGMESGEGAGCVGGSTGCTFTGGCVSLPDDLGMHGLRH